MLLESCQKVEHKLIMIELAEQFEVEKQEQRMKERERSEMYDEKISNLKDEVKEKENLVFKLQDELAKHQEEYNRLN